MPIVSIAAVCNGQNISLPIYIDTNLASRTIATTSGVHTASPTKDSIRDALSAIVGSTLAPATAPALITDIFSHAILRSDWSEALLTPLHAFAVDASQECGFFPSVDALGITSATPVYTRSGHRQIGYLEPFNTFGMVWKSTTAASDNNRIAAWWISLDASIRGFIRGDIPVLPSTAITGGVFTISNVNPSSYGSLLKFADYWGQYEIQHNRVFAATSLSSVGNTSISLANLAQLLDDISPDGSSSPPDPYTGSGYPESTAPGGYSDGNFDFTEDGLSGVHTPTLDILNCGLVTAWRPSKATLAQLSQWLWTTTPGQIIQQLFGNPINAIIGLHIVPVSPDVDSGSGTIKFGAEDSGVACHKITSQHVTVDCGSLKITHKYGSYMDYAPQASAEIFLPYVGGMPLDVNDVIDKTLSVRYKVDVLSGACVAYVFVDGVLHYQKSGCCAATAPITGSQMPNVISGVLSIVGSVAGAIASVGSSGAGTAAKVASGIATGTSVAESAANMMKQSISYSGTVSGWAGLLGAQKPYVILTLPNAAIPGGQNTLMGYPAWVSGKVGDFRGYTECAIDRVYSYRATDQEVEEIKSLMAGGVVL